MGMYDTIHFSCPRCDTHLETQSKRGECKLFDIPASAVPPEIAADIEREVIHCPKCNRGFIVVALNLPKTVAMALVAEP